MLFHRVQTLLGFGLLLCGFAAQLYARAVPQLQDASGSAARWTGAVVLAAALLELSAWWWSLVTVRRHLRAWFRQHPPDFDRDPNLAREALTPRSIGRRYRPACPPVGLGCANSRGPLTHACADRLGDAVVVNRRVLDDVVVAQHRRRLVRHEPKRAGNAGRESREQGKGDHGANASSVTGCV
jgi:hypothetical protein